MLQPKFFNRTIPWNCETAIGILEPLTKPLFCKKKAEIEQKVIAFFLERGEEKGRWFCVIWVAWWPDFFCENVFFLFFSLWVRAVSVKIGIFKRFIKHTFCLLECYLWWKFQEYQTISGGVRASKPPQKGHFMDAESVRKILKIYNFTTTNAILMKLTKVMYLHKTFHFIKDWAVTHRA